MESKEKCIFCGNDQSSFAFKISDIFGITRQMKVCKHCHTYFLSPQPTADELGGAYDESYYGRSETKFKWTAIENTIDRFRSGRAKRMARLLKPGARILDIGCGNGRYLMHLSKLGQFELHGTELPGRSAERAKQIKGIDLFIGNFEEAEFPENSFDSISLYHVLEHLQDPAGKLQAIMKLIRSGGVLALSFPNVRSVQARLLKGAWLHFDPPRHLFLPDHRFLERFMNEQGFILLRKKYFSPEQNPYGLVQGLLNVFSRKRDVLFERLKGNRNYAPEYGPVQMFFQKLFFLWAMPHCIISDIFESAFGAGATVELTFRKE